MANQNDSFIDEVTEDLRRDRLFATFRRYGWIAILLVLGIVGGAIWREYSQSQSLTNAQAYGDAVRAAQTAEDPVAALAAIDTQGAAGRAALTGLLIGGTEAEAGRTPEATKTLEAAAASAGDDVLMRDLALLKAVIIAGAGMDAAQRDKVLSDLSKPGAPFELLALEQKAIALIGADRSEDAEVLIRQIQQKDGMTESLRRRLSEMMIVLGADPSANQGPGPQPMTPAPAN